MHRIQNFTGLNPDYSAPQEWTQPPIAGGEDLAAPRQEALPALNPSGLERLALSIHPQPTFCSIAPPMNITMLVIATYSIDKKYKMTLFTFLFSVIFICT